LLGKASLSGKLAGGKSSSRAGVDIKTAPERRGLLSCVTVSPVSAVTISKKHDKDGCCGSLESGADARPAGVLQPSTGLTVAAAGNFRPSRYSAAYRLPQHLWPIQVSMPGRQVVCARY